MRHHQLRRRVRQPLRQRQVLVDRALEHFQKFQIRRPGVFNVMRQGFLNVPDVATLEILGSRPPAGREHRHPPLARIEKLPLIRIGVPVQFAQPARLQRHHRRRRGRHRKTLRIDDPHFAALVAHRRRIFHRPKRKIDRRHSQGPRRHPFILFERRRQVRLKNEIFFFGKIRQRALAHPEILGHHVRRCMRHPIRQQHRLVLRKISIVEYQQEFAAVRPQPLNRMWNPGREEPQLILGHIGDETFPLQIDAGDARVAVQHDRPLGSRVPMQLPHPARRQAHVHARQTFRHRQLALRHLPRPSPFLQPLMRERKRILERLHPARIRRQWMVRARILRVQHRVRRPRIAPALVGDRLGARRLLRRQLLRAQHAGRRQRC